MEEFRAGALKFLRLKLEGNATSFTKATKVGGAPEDFKARFPATLVRTRTLSPGKYGDEEIEISQDNAKNIFEGLQKQVEDQVNSGSDADVRGPETVREKDFGAPAFSSSGVVDTDIVVKPEFAQLAVRKDVAASFDGFWILLHELRHRAGKIDAEIKAYGGPEIAKAERPLTSRGRTTRQKVTLIGEVVSELNVLRYGFNLPIRTTYADNDVIRFRLKPIGQDSDREEFVGVNLTRYRWSRPTHRNRG